MQNAKKVTIKDIARAAGVSNMSVSLALNGKPGISDATRQRILQTAEELHYVPNQIAQSLLSDRTHTLGVVNSMASIFVFGKVMRGIMHSAEAAGYSTIISSTDERYDKETQAIDTLLNKRVDGIILIGPVSTSEDLMKISSFGIPFISLLRQRGSGISFCQNNNVKGAHTLMDYLISTGSRRFCFFPFPEAISSGGERMSGFKDSMTEHGIDPGQQTYISTEPNIESGYAAAREMLKQGLTADTIVCGCDLTAVGVLKALNEAGIQVPGQVRLAGYDDIDLAEHLSVPLTTVHQPYERIGRLGTRLLLQAIDEPDLGPLQVTLDSELVVRSST